jgi:hypothetical protein
MDLTVLLQKLRGQNFAFRGRRLARVRYAPVATKFRSAPK